jgi:hypothetical protein
VDTLRFTSMIDFFLPYLPLQLKDVSARGFLEQTAVIGSIVCG